SSLNQKFSSVNFCCHIGQHKVNRLETGNGFSKLMSFLSIFQSCLVGTTSNSQRKCRDGDSTSVQDFHGLFETFPYFSESVAVRNPHLINNKFGRFRSSHPLCVLLFSGCKSRHSFFEEKCCRIIF